MLTHENSGYGGVLRLATGELTIDVAKDFGPRIVGLTPAGGINLLAELGDLGIELDDGRRFTFSGGHRLWVAPEVPAVTYEPDDEAILWSREGESLTVTGVTGTLEKSMSIRVEDSTVTLAHRLANLGANPMSLAPWAITQFRPGGTALLPFDRGSADDHGLQASHALVGWPYTDWAALGYDAAAGVILIDGNRSSPTKVGTSLARGWLAYAADGWLFAKFARPAQPSPVDRGAQAEVYANANFVELETLGALTTLGEGEAVTHQEVWRIGTAPEALSEVPDIVASWQEDL